MALYLTKEKIFMLAVRRCIENTHRESGVKNDHKLNLTKQTKSPQWFTSKQVLSLYISPEVQLDSNKHKSLLICFAQT